MQEDIGGGNCKAAQFEGEQARQKIIVYRALSDAGAAGLALVSIVSEASGSVISVLSFALWVVFVLSSNQIRSVSSGFS